MKLQCKYCGAENLLHSKYCCQCGRVQLELKPGEAVRDEHELEIDNIIYDMFIVSQEANNASSNHLLTGSKDAIETKELPVPDDVSKQPEIEPEQSSVSPESTPVVERRTLLINGIVAFIQLPCMLLALIFAFVCVFTKSYPLPTTHIGFDQVEISLDRNWDRLLMIVIVVLILVCLKSIYDLTVRVKGGPKQFVLFFIASAIVLPVLYLGLISMYSEITLSTLITVSLKRYFVCCIGYLLFIIVYYKRNNDQFTVEDWKIGASS